MARVFETAAIRFVPDFTGFKTELKAQLAEISKDPAIRVKVKATPDMTGFKTALKNELRVISADPLVRVKVKATPDMTGFKTALRAGVRDAGVDIKAKIQPDFTGLQAKLNAESRVRDLHINVRVNPTGIGALGRLGGAAGGAAGRIGGAGSSSIGGGALDGIIDFGRAGIRPMTALIAAGLALSPVLVAVSSSAILASTSIAAIGPASLGAVTAVGAVAGALQGPLTTIKAFSAYQETGGVAALAKYNTELAKLSPTGRNFLTTLIAMKSGALDFRKAIETVTLPGFIKFLQEVRDKGRSGSSVVDIMKKSVLDMGKTISDTTGRIGDFVRSDFFKDRLSTIVKNNQKAFENLGRATTNLLKPLTSIFTSASPLLIRFTGYLDKLTARFGAWISEAERTGKLDTWFKKAGDELAKWWGIAGNIFGILRNIFTASLPTGQGLVGRLQAFTKSIKDFTGSTEGQAKIKAFFDFFRDIDYGKLFKTVGQIVLILGVLTAFKFASANPLFALFAVFAATYPKETAATINSIARGVGSIIGWASDHPDAVKLLLLLFAAFKISMMTKMWGAAGAASGSAFSIAFNFVTAGTMGKFTALGARFTGMFTALGAGAGTAFGVAFNIAAVIGVAAIGLAIGVAIEKAFDAGIKAIFGKSLSDMISDVIDRLPGQGGAIGKDGLTDKERGTGPSATGYHGALSPKDVARAAAQPNPYNDAEAWATFKNPAYNNPAYMPGGSVYNQQVPRAPIASVTGPGAYIGSIFVPGKAAIARAKAEQPQKPWTIEDYYNQLIKDQAAQDKAQAAADKKAADKAKADEKKRLAKEKADEAKRIAKEKADALAALKVNVSAVFAGDVFSGVKPFAKLIRAAVDPSAIYAATGQIADAVKTAFAAGAISASKQSSLLATIKSANTKLLGFVKDRAAIAKDLEKANEKLATIKSTASTAGAGVKEFGGLFHGDTTSASSIITSLTARLSWIKKFSANVLKLKKQGWSQSIIQQVIDAGPEAGGQMADVLLAANPNDRAQINELSRQVSATAKTYEKNVFNTLGGASAQGIVAGLKAKDKDVADAMERTAKLMVKAIKKALKIKSPSEVMSDIGELMSTGLAGGIDSKASKAKDSITGLNTKLTTEAGKLPGAIKTALAGITTVFGDAFTAAVPSTVTGLNKIIDTMNLFLTNVETVTSPFDVHVLTGKGNKKGIPDVVSKAGGGPIYGPGTKTSDSIPLWASKGEFVQQAAAVDHYGLPFMQAVNDRKFATGGSVDSVKSWLPSVDPLPYVWGATGPKAYDCSGLVGEVYRLLTGKDGYGRVMTTSSDMASLGFLRGRGTFTMGLDPGHHMAGNLGGLKFEAASTKSGIKIGASARGIGTFPQQWYLPNLGSAFSGDAGGGSLAASGLPLPSFAGNSPAAMAALSKAALGQLQTAALAGANSAPGGDPGGAIGGSPSANETLGRRMAAALGWGGSQADALDRLWTRESGWRNTAQNPTSTAYGIPQFLNSTWASVGATKTSDAAKQIAAGLKYIGQRYGTPAKAWAHETSAGWYEKGTPYVPQDGPAYLHKGEAVIPANANKLAAGGLVQATIRANETLSSYQARVQASFGFTPSYEYLVGLNPEHPKVLQAAKANANHIAALLTAHPESAAQQTSDNAKVPGGAVPTLPDQVTALRKDLRTGLKDIFTGDYFSGIDPLNTIIAKITDPQSVLSATNSLASKVKDIFNQGGISLNAKDRALAAIKDNNDTLVFFVNQRVEIAKKLEVANAKLADINSGADTAATGFKTFGSVFARGGDDTSTSTIIGSLTLRLNWMKTFAANIAKLKAQGWAPSIIQEVIDAGPNEVGAQMAKVLSEASAADFASINSLTGQIADTATAYRGTAFTALGGDIAQGIVDGLKASESDLAAQMENIANVLIATLTNQLGIHSPSKVMHKLGRHIATGLATGITDGIPEASGAMKKLTGVATLPNRSSGRVELSDKAIDRLAKAMDKRRGDAPLIGQAVIKEHVDADLVMQRLAWLEKRSRS